MKWQVERFVKLDLFMGHLLNFLNDVGPRFSGQNAKMDIDGVKNRENERGDEELS